MKKWLVSAMVFFASATGMASEAFQLKHITGDWDFGKGNAVFRIYKQTENTVKALKCNRETWLTTGGTCSYSEIMLFYYNSKFDGFCMKGRRNCEIGIQVSLEYPNEMLEIIDPLSIYGFSNSGSSLMARKGE